MTPFVSLQHGLMKQLGACGCGAGGCGSWEGIGGTLGDIGDSGLSGGGITKYADCGEY